MYDFVSSVLVIVCVLDIYLKWFSVVGHLLKSFLKIFFIEF